jgi:hypothetical protein
MTATDVRDRARSLADLPNSQVITSDDELNSLNETYHDVYDWLLQNDDDYYLTEISTTLTASMLSATSQQNLNNEYILPLPSDFYRLRYLDWNQNNIWQPVNKMPLSARDVAPASPMYRIRGGNLWLVGGMNTSYTVRIGYYPSPPQITIPFQTLTFGTSYGPATFQNVSEPFFTNGGQTMLYALNSTTLVSESILGNTISSPVSIFNAAATITQIQAYKGYVYLLYNTNNIFRAQYATLSSTLTFAAITTSNDITDYGIYKDVIYACISTAVKTLTLAGTVTGTLGLALAAPMSPAVIGSNVYYVDSSNNLKLVGNTATIMANVKNVETEGTYLYINDTSNNLYRATVTTATLGTLATLSTDCLTVHSPEVAITTPQSSLDQVYLPVITRETPQLLALGSSPPYTFGYPNNLFTELMSYQMAMDFKSKAGQDPSLLAGRLGSRDVGNQCTGLWLRMYQSIKRDDFQPERINNRYENPWGIW